MNILRRVYGLVIILRALLPILLLVAAIFIVWRFLADVRAVVRQPIERINQNIAKMNDKIDDAAEGFETVGEGIAEVSGAVNQAAGLIGNIPAAINVNLDPVPVPVGFNTRRIRIPGVVSFDLPTSIRTANFELDKAIPIPGLSQVKGFLGNTFGFINDISQVLTNIVSLVSITQEMGEILQAGKQAVDEALAVFQKWATVAGVILVLTILLLITSYVEYLYRNLPRGWSLLMGRPAWPE